MCVLSDEVALTPWTINVQNFRKEKSLLSKKGETKYLLVLTDDTINYVINIVMFNV